MKRGMPSRIKKKGGCKNKIGNLGLKEKNGTDTVEEKTKYQNKEKETEGGDTVDDLPSIGRLNKGTGEGLQGV